jgi:hypothetical protein
MNENTFYKTYNYNNYVFKNIFNPIKPQKGFYTEELSKLEEIIYKRKHHLD